MGSHIVDVLFVIIFSLIDIFSKFIKVLQVAWQLCFMESRQDILWHVTVFMESRRCGLQDYG